MEIEEPSTPKKPRVSLSDRMEVIRLKKNKETDINPKSRSPFFHSPFFLEYVSEDWHGRGH